MKSILGRKVGMTQVFTKTGEVVPVTVVEVLPNVVLQKKTVESDGYFALRVGYEDKRASLATKPESGLTTKANTQPKQFVREIKGDELEHYNVGEEVKVDIFNSGDAIDVTGKTKGKGFSGVIKRYGFIIGPKGHGSGYHRAIGSLATSGRWNNRVHPGRKMPGHHGFTTKTMLNLVVVSVDVENNLMLIKGPVPGANRSLITIRSAVKAQKHKTSPFELVKYEAPVVVSEEKEVETVEEVVVEQEIVDTTTAEATVQEAVEANATEETKVEEAKAE